MNSLNPTLAAEVESCRGTFDKGHTSEDAAATLAPLSKALGFYLTIVWNYEDIYGCGGDSDMMVIDSRRRFCEIPPELWTFLYEPDNTVDFEKVRADFKPGRVRYRRDIGQGEGLEHNHVLKVYPCEAPTMA